MIKGNKYGFLLMFMAICLCTCSNEGIPPSAIFNYAPEDGTRYHIFHFDASDTYDADNPKYSLKYRWDFNGDEQFDTEFSDLSYASFKYPAVDCYRVTLEVKDPEGHLGILIQEVCVSSRNNEPIPNLNVLPPISSLSSTVKMDGSGTFDWEEKTDSLWFRFDIDGDGIWETDYQHQPWVSYTYQVAGLYRIVMEVKDGDQAVVQTEKLLEVVNTYNEFSYLTDLRDGNTYGTVKINNHWVMAENLRYGTFVENSSTPMNNGICEVFGYNDLRANISKYGALYIWGELMEYTGKEGGQGVCPDGWHVPDDQEWKDFEQHLGMREFELNENGWDRGEGLAPQLMTGQKSGFSAGLYGFRLPFRLFSNFNNETYFWSSSMLEDGSVWIRGLANKSSGIFRGNYRNNYSFSVRCFKN